MTTHRNAVSVFLSYAHEDEPLLRKLETHLSLLKRQGLISTWYDRQIVPGTNWAKVIDERLELASIILLLVSPDFLASDYCYQVEMKRALERHEAGQAQVIPIVMRPTDWKGAPFAHLQALPTDAKAITTWSNQDEAFLRVAEGIRKVVEVTLARETGKRNKEAQEPEMMRQKLSRFGAAFPPVWNVPYRHAAFVTGRDHVLEQLFAGFTSEPKTNTILVQSLTGLGGLGKTQTAVEYAYRYRKEYRTVLWARADTDQDLITSFKVIAGLLERPQTHLQNRESLIASMQEWYLTATDWLLIIDNADNLDQVRPFLPTAARGHLLLTTRVTAMGNLAQPLALDPLEPEDGALCILRRAKYLSWAGQLSDASPASVGAAQTLSQLMDGLPLALEQAGAYIEATGRGVRGYLDLYRHYRPEIQRHLHGVAPDYRKPVAFAWNIARDMVEQQNAAASELLRLCAYLAPDAIPYEIFTEGAIALGPVLGPVAANPMALDRAIALLRDHSLLKNEVDHGTDISRLFIHRMMQELLKDDMDSPLQRLWAERAVRAVACALPAVERQIMQAHARSCMSLIEQWDMSSPEADLLRQWMIEEDS
jgi:TIR domain/AAA domain